MPKRKAKPPSKEDIAAALQRLDDHLEVGKLLRQKRPANEEARLKIANGFPVNTNYSNLQKMRRLAELLYGKLDENRGEKSGNKTWQLLRRLRLKGSGLPLSWGHCVALTSVRTCERLLEVAQQAAKSGWSATEVCRYLRLDSGGLSRRPGSGSPVRKPKNLQEGLQSLLADLAVVEKRLVTLREVPAPDEIGNKLVFLGEAVKSLTDSEAIKQALSEPIKPAPPSKRSHRKL